jgi:uncharacterized SAM-binding protein YcdF (DUF218 family)
MRALLEAATTLPMPFLILQAAALLLWRYARISRLLFGMATALFLAAALPMTGKVMMRGLYASVPTSDPATASGLSAIVVPTAGAYPDGNGRWWPGHNTVYRTAAGLRVHEQSGLPLIVVGGKPNDLLRAEADVIADHYGLARRPGVIIENTARDSIETGLTVADIVKRGNARAVLLVTSCSHYARMAASLRHFDVAVFRPPATCTRYELTGIADLLPGIRGYKLTREAVREYVAILWYLASRRLSARDLL